MKRAHTPVGSHFTLPHQVHFFFGPLQQRLLVLKLGGVHVFADALVLSVGEARQRQEGLRPLTLQPGVPNS